MKRWLYEPLSYTKDEVKDFCVNDAVWQRFRLSLKGLSTEAKLDKLQSYYSRYEPQYLRIPRRIRVQVDNYINALKRGGLLDSQSLEVRR